MSTAWTSRYAQRTKGIKSSAIRELLKFTQRPEVISFAGGLPAAEVFPPSAFGSLRQGARAASRIWPCSTARPKVTNLCAR